MPEQQGQGHYPTSPPMTVHTDGAKLVQQKSAATIADEANQMPIGTQGVQDPTSPRFAPNG